MMGVVVCELPDGIGQYPSDGVMRTGTIIDNTTVQSERYMFPTVSVCFAAGVVGYGCDSWTLNCADTARTYIFGGRGFDLDDSEANASSVSTVNKVSIVVAARLNGLTVDR